MSCLSKIKHAYESFNASQRSIGDYICQNPTAVVHMSVQELAYATNTSPSTIVRFAKKIGYDGYPSLKIELATDTANPEENLLDDHPSLNHTFVNFLKQEQHAYLNTVNKTFELINSHALEQVVNLALNARRIYLVGIGASSYICNDLMVKLSRIDAPVIFYEDSHVQLANSIHLNSDDLLIAISYRGNTKEVNIIVEQAVSKSIRTVAITQNNGSILSGLADIVLPVPSEENEFRLGAITSRNATQIITDLIYLGVLKHQVAKSSQDLIESRKVIYKLRESL